jgi:hypothetical protein
VGVAQVVAVDVADAAVACRRQREMMEARRGERRAFLRRAARSTIRSTVRAGLLTAAVSACAFLKPGGSSASTYRSPIRLTVENKSPADLTIYVRHDGRAERLERVDAARTTKLVIPARMISLVGDMVLIGERPAFGGRIVSQSVTVHTCERLEWTIEAQLNHSILAVVPVENCK